MTGKSPTNLEASLIMTEILLSGKLYFSSFNINHEIFSTVILSLPLIQDGQLSVSGKRMCTILVKRLED